MPKKLFPFRTTLRIMCGLQEQETCMPVCHCPCSPSRLPHLTQCFSVTHSFKTTDKNKLAFLLRDRTSQRCYSCFFFHLNLLLLLEEHTSYLVWRDQYCSFEESQVSWRTLSVNKTEQEWTSYFWTGLALMGFFLKDLARPVLWYMASSLFSMTWAHILLTVILTRQRSIGVCL